MTHSQPWPAPTASAPVDASVTVPGSKSASNRALIIAALADGPSRLTGLLDARDTRLMIGALEQLGIEFDIASCEEPGNMDVVVTPHLMRGPATIDVGLAGTVMRFVPPLSCLAHGEISFDGDDHARKRPMATVIESIKDLGVEVFDRGTGRLPFMINARGEVRGGEVTVDASKSSQFISGLLLSAARFNSGLTIHHVGDPVPSMPHIEMTIAMLAENGVRVHRAGDSVWHVDPHGISALDRSIEPDLSNAAPFLAAALVTGGRVRVRHWPAQTTQPGDSLRGLLAAMGAEVALTDGDLVVTGSGVIHGIDADLSAVGELTPTIAALAALADSPTTISGVAHLRGHETDRLMALVSEINRLGGDAVETEDGLVIRPADLHGGVVNTYDDHRMATFAAIIGLRVPGIGIENVGTTAKTLPNFEGRWHDLLRGSAA